MVLTLLKWYSSHLWKEDTSLHPYLATVPTSQPAAILLSKTVSPPITSQPSLTYSPLFQILHLTGSFPSCVTPQSGLPCTSPLLLSFQLHSPWESPVPLQQVAEPFQSFP